MNGEFVRSRREEVVDYFIDLSQYSQPRAFYYQIYIVSKLLITVRHLMTLL
jgi:hypothetical protein